MAQQVVHTRVRFVDSVTLQDAVSMNFVFEATGSNTTIETSDIHGHLVSFFNNDATGQSQALSLYLSENLSRATNASFFDYTDITNHLDGTPAGPPFASDQWTLGVGPSNERMPDQVAIACGYRSAYGSATEHGPAEQLPSDDSAIDQGAPLTHLGSPRPRARMRGRFYLGPVSLLTLDTTTGNPSTTCLNNIGIAMNNFCSTQQSGLADQFDLVVWSRRDKAVYTVGSQGFYYVNEGYATQRRRSDTTEVRRHLWQNVTT